MRRLRRAVLPERVLSYLAKKQRDVNSGKSAEALWTQARRTLTMRRVFDELKRMVVTRERCMFCEDSRGVEIDHFWPKARYPERAFVWENLLLICADCNRRKSDRLELDSHGLPMLIDPTREDPWAHLFYDSRTGIVTARFILATREPDPRGQYTVEGSNLPLNDQAVTEGRQRTQRNLIRCVNRFVGALNAAIQDCSLAKELLVCVDDNSDYGLTSWFFFRDGQSESPFADLRSTARDVWDRLVARTIAAT